MSMVRMRGWYKYKGMGKKGGRCEMLFMESNGGGGGGGGF